MTSLLPHPTGHQVQARSVKSSPHRLPSPPVAFSTSPARRSRADSPSPMNLQPRTYISPRARRERTTSSDEADDLPPSISQRRVPSRNTPITQKGRDGERGKLMLPVESDHTLREKRSFERTRKWAEDAEGLRRAEVAAERYDENEGSIEGLVSDRSIDGSSASPIPPRTPSPAPSSRRAPQIALTLPSEKPAPILSIDDIIRQHSASAQTAMGAAKARARRELGLAPSPTSSTPGSPSSGKTSKPSTPRPSAGLRLTSKSASPPEIPVRTSSSPIAKVHLIPSRSSSIRSFTPGSDSLNVQTTSPLHSPVRFMSTTPDHRSIYPTPPSSRPPQPHASLPPILPNRSQSTLPFSPAFDSPTPGSSRARPAASRSSTAPPSTTSAQADQAHEMALHLRSEPLNKFFTFPRPFPDRPLRVSYAEVGKADGCPVLVFLGVGCVRYLMAIYDQLALVYGLRLICVDRWGYGKTDQVDQVDRGLVEWSGVIAQVIAKLQIDKFQIIAHSAGTPYAMAVARRFPEKIRGRVHLLAPWVGQDHDTVSQWLKWVPGGVIRTATAADHRLQTYFLGKAPRLSYAPISFDARVTPPLQKSASTHSELSIEELEESPKSSSLIRRASTVFSSSTKPRSRSIYGTAASASTINLSLPHSLPPPRSVRRAESTRSATSSPEKCDTMSLLGRSPGLKNLAAMRSIQMLSGGPPSSASRDTSSSAPSSDMLVTPDQSQMAISASELDFGLGEGFGSFATDLGLAMPVLENMSKSEKSSIRPASESSGQMSRSTSGISNDPPSSLPTNSTLPQIEPDATNSAPILPASRFPSDPAFSTALSQASHAECEPGTTSDILRIILNKPHRPWGFRLEDVAARTHVWLGDEDKIISRESVQWMEEVCGSTVERRAGEGHNLMSSPNVLVDLFKCLGEEAREGQTLEARKEKQRKVDVEKDREDRWKAEGVQRKGGGY